MIASDWIHPMRYFRTRPTRAAVQRYVYDVGRDLPTMTDMNQCVAALQAEYNRRIMRLPREQRPRDITILSEEATLAMIVGSYVAWGRNVFVLHRGLVEILRRTDLGDVRVEDVRVPFDVCYIAFGDAFAESLPGMPNQIDGAYVSWRDEAKQITVTSRRTDMSAKSSKDWPLNGEPRMTLMFSVPDPELTIAEKLTKEIDATIAEALARRSQWVTGEGKVTREDESPAGQAVARRFTEGRHVFEQAIALCINALLFLGAEPTDVVPAFPADSPYRAVERVQRGSPREKDHARADLLRGGFSEIHIIGENAAHSDASHRAVDEDGKTGREMPTHWRRGHWRRQRVGPHRADVRIIRIPPVLVRGDRGTPDVGHVYDVDSPPRANTERPHH